MIYKVWDCFSNKQKSIYKQKFSKGFNTKKYLFKLKTGVKFAYFVKNSKIGISWTVYPRILNKAFLKS